MVNHTNEHKQNRNIPIAHDKGVQPTIATPANASALLQLSKLIPKYMGYNSEQPTSDDKIFREHIRTEWNSCRKQLESARLTSLGHNKQKLDSIITELDVVESDLRASPTGDFSKKISNLKSINKEKLEELITLDLELIEEVQSLRMDIQTLVASDEEQPVEIGPILSQIGKFRGAYSARRSLINGVPLNVIRGSPPKRSIKWLQVFSLLASIAAISVTVYFNLR